MAANHRVYDSHHLQADCQQLGSTPEPYARQLSVGWLYLFNTVEEKDELASWRHFDRATRCTIARQSVLRKQQYRCELTATSPDSWQSHGRLETVDDLLQVALFLQYPRLDQQIHRVLSYL